MEKVDFSSKYNYYYFFKFLIFNTVNFLKKVE